MSNVIVEEYIPEAVLRDKVKELGKKITNDFKGSNLLIIGVLKGSFIFMADLVREIDLPVEISFLSVSSYGAGTASSGSARLLCDIDRPLLGRDVLIVEDIVDSGHTLHYLKENLSIRKPKSIAVCSLLDKPSRRVAAVQVDYCGFEIEDEFVVGYGLDYAGQYRNIKNISKLTFK